MKLFEKLNNLSKHPSFYIFALGGFGPLVLIYQGMTLPDGGGFPFLFMMLFCFAYLSLCITLSCIAYIICETYDFKITNERITKNIFLRVICWLLNIISIISIILFLYVFIRIIIG